MRRVLPIALLLIALPALAYAQAANPVDQMVGQFKASSAGWQAPLQTIALGTFGLLAFINFAWAMARIALKRGDFSEFVTELVNQVMFLGLFFWLLTEINLWGPAIIDGFRLAAGTASGMKVLTPGDVIYAGVDIAGIVLAQMSIMHPATSAAFMIAAIVLIVCFALIAATLVIALVRSYIIAGCGVLFMAGGGSIWTNGMAQAVIRKFLSIGAGLFACQLIVSIGMDLVHQWAAQFKDVTNEGLLVQIGCALILLVVSWIIPNDIASMVGEGVFSHGAALLGAAAAVGAAAEKVGAATDRIATYMAGAGTAAGSAARLASTQVAKDISRGNGPTSRMGRAAALTGRTAANMANAVRSDIGSRLSGQSMGRGVTGFRVADGLRQQEEKLRAGTSSLPSRRP